MPCALPSSTPHPCGSQASWQVMMWGSQPLCFPFFSFLEAPPWPPAAAALLLWAEAGADRWVLLRESAS